MIRITFKNGETAIYNGESYTDYLYDRRCFIVVKDLKWIGIYNLDCIDCIVIE